MIHKIWPTTSCFVRSYLVFTRDQLKLLADLINEVCFCNLHTQESLFISNKWLCAQHKIIYRNICRLVVTALWIPRLGHRCPQYNFYIDIVRIYLRRIKLPKVHSFSYVLYIFVQYWEEIFIYFTTLQIVLMWLYCLFINVKFSYLS